MSIPRQHSRFRSYLRFLGAVLYFFLARALASRGAMGLAGEQWQPLAEQALLVFLLLLGYAGFGFSLDHELHPVSRQGLPRRAGWPSEFGMGLAVGWAIAVACVLPMVLDGGIAIVLNVGPRAWGWLLVDAAYFALLALGEEIAFRGYGFQHFIAAVGPMAATLGFAVFYAILQGSLFESSRASFSVSLLLGIVLSTAYLRTQALWLSWGLNFGWKASRALLFGLAVAGNTSHSPLIEGDPMGPFWLTGGGYGLDGSWMAFAALLLSLPVVYRLTRNLDYRYNAPVIVPGGIPVDLEAAGRRQHEAVAYTTEAVPALSSPLVQILSVQPPAPPVTLDDSSRQAE